MNYVEKPVTVNFNGEERALRYDFAAFRAIEDRTRKSIIRDGYTSEDLKDTSFFVVCLWGGLTHALPTLTVQEVERSIMLRDYPILAERIMQALKQSAGEPDTEETQEDPANPPNAQASDGQNSGA